MPDPRFDPRFRQYLATDDGEQAVDGDLQAGSLAEAFRAPPQELTADQEADALLQSYMQPQEPEVQAPAAQQPRYEPEEPLSAVAAANIRRGGGATHWVTGADGKPYQVASGAYKPPAPPKTGGGPKYTIEAEITQPRDVEPADPTLLYNVMQNRAARTAYYAEQERAIYDSAAETEAQLIDASRQQYEADMQRLQRQELELRHTLDELATRDVKPGMVFDNPVEAGLFSAIAAMAAVMDDQVAMGMIDKAIDRSIAAQESNLQHGRAVANQQMQLYQNLRATFNDKQSADAAYRAMLLGVYEKQLKANAARAGGKDAVGAMAQTFAQLKYEKESALAAALAGQANKAKVKLETRNAKNAEGLWQLADTLAGASREEEAAEEQRENQAATRRGAKASRRGGVKAPRQQGAPVFNTDAEAAQWAVEQGWGEFSTVTVGNKFMPVQGNVVEARSESATAAIESRPSAQPRGGAPIELDIRSTDDAFREWSNLPKEQKDTIMDAQDGLNLLIEMRNELAAIIAQEGNSWERLIPRTDLRNQLDEIYSELMQYQRAIQETGVLNVSELPFLEKSVLDTSKLFQSPEAALARIDRQIKRGANKFKRMVNSRFAHVGVRGDLARGM